MNYMYDDYDDNPLNFNTNPDPFWEIQENNKMKYDEVIPKNADWYSQSYEFTMDWLKEIRVENRKQKSNQRRGMPYKRVLKQWSKLYGENDLAEIVRCARKVMDAIRADHPQIGQYL